MKKTIKTEKVLALYRTLNTAKYTKMSDDDKIKAWKIARALSPVATKFEEDSKDAAEKMKPSEDFTERLQKAQEYEKCVKDGNTDKLPMGAAEYDAFLKEFTEYNRLVSNAVKEFGEKEVEIEYTPLSEDAFGKLMASNEWDFGKVVELGEFIVE